MLKKIGIGLGALVVVFATLVVLQPGHFKVSRSTVIPAPPEAVFAVLDGFDHFADWSPWEERDPAMRTEQSGPAAGAGASYRWSGNDEVGEGRMTIIEAVPNQRVAIRLEFIRPFAAVNSSVFTLRPEGDGTRVTWSMSGDQNLVGKAFSLLRSNDAMIGPDFEKGLAALAPVVEHVAIESRASTREAFLGPDVCQPDRACTAEEMKCTQPSRMGR